MFRQRLLTALVLIPIVLLAIFYANMWLLSAIILILVAAGGWEWSQLIPLHFIFYKILFIVVLLFTASSSLYWLNDNWLLIGLAFWALILVAIVTFPASQAFWGHRIIVGGSCLFLFSLFLGSLAFIYQYHHGRELIIYMLFLVWAADTGAYLAGKRWGQKKLIPVISPGKTIEGSLGGFILGMLVAFIACFYFKPTSMMIWYATAAGTILISMVGDLFISMLKRRCKLKDTGNLFPGHGGVLDRIDSWIAAAPAFYYGLSFLKSL